MPKQNEGFPKTIFTKPELEKARKLVKKGYKHRLKVIGDSKFKQKVREALKLVKTVGHYGFLRTYIGKIVEVDGLSQLRESEAAIWVNKYLIEDSVEAASFFVMKTWQMKQFLEEELYFGGEAEEELNQKRVRFLESLMKKTRKNNIKKRCEELLTSWRESTFL